MCIRDSINREVFTPASDDLLISDDMRRLLDELLVYYGDAMKSQQPKYDYLELLHFSWTFLGGAPGSCVKFRAPGAMHHARWMAKAIYSCSRTSLFSLLQRRKASLTSACLSPLSTAATGMKHLLLKELLSMTPDFLHRYKLTHIKLLVMPQQRLSIATFGTSWNISQGLDFFDNRVDAVVKKEMVKNLQHLPKPKALKRLEGGRFNHQSPLDTFVTQSTAELFDVLVKNGGFFSGL